MFNHLRKTLKNKDGFVFSSTVAAMTAIGVGASMATAVGVGVTAATIGLGAYAVNRMTQQPGSSSTTPQPLPAAPSVDSAAAKAEESVKNKRRAISRNKTIFTNPMGLSDSEKSDTALKTLTGV